MTKSTSKIDYLSEHTDMARLRLKAEKRIPKFAFEYLDGGCNEDVNLFKNTKEIRDIELKPYYLNEINPTSMKCHLFGQEYDAPFGISPVGLQGLIWPNSPEILAKAAFAHNIPFILSTLTTMSIERAGELTEGKAWFQLYHPVEDKLRDDLLSRAHDAGIKVLVLLADVPIFGFRSREIRNGFSVPPRMNIRNIIQILNRPKWAFKTLIYGIPKFATMEPYIPKGTNLQQLGVFMNKTFNGVLTVEKVARLRDKWKGKLVLKGVATEEDTDRVIKLGLDGVIVSNHGGRQLDAGESSIKPLERIAKKYSKKITVMMDSGIRSGPDIGRVLAAGAEAAFLGRTFMYGMGALGSQGGTHTISLLKTQLMQLMEQIRCEKVSDFPKHMKVEE